MRVLAGLIERHRPGGAPSTPRLEPRLPSRFEPVPGAADPEGVAPDLVVEVPREAAAAMPGAPARPAPAPPAAGGPVEAGPPPPGLLGAAVSAARATVEGPAMAPPGARPVTAPPPRVDTPSAPARPAPPADTSEPVSPGGPPVERARRTFLEPVPERRPAPPVASAVRIDRAPSAPSGSTTIHVSIGRVDVRAIVTPASAPARPPAPASGVSLEDYLQGRRPGPR
jgi:hypothetical protein